MFSFNNICPLCIDLYFTSNADVLMSNDVSLTPMRSGVRGLIASSTGPASSFNDARNFFGIKPLAAAMEMVSHVCMVEIKPFTSTNANLLIKDCPY